MTGMATSDFGLLCLHHVGGRDGSRAFPLLPRFEGDFLNVIYEADADCLEQIRDFNTPLASGFRLMPHCLGAHNGTETLNVCHDQFTSSLYPPNPRYAEYYGFFEDKDYVLAQAMRVCETRSVSVATLDALCLGDGAVPAPDFLSIDTQGAEYDILRGGQKVVSGNVLAVYCEVEFVPLYQGQKLFGDVTALLEEYGLGFAAFTRIESLSSRREALGLRGQGLTTYGEALFLRHPEQVESDDPVLARLRHLKAGFIAVIYDLFEFGLAHLRRAVAGDGGPAFWEALPALSYVGFMRELWEAVLAMPEVFPAGFYDHYPTPGDSAKRFVKDGDLRASGFVFETWRAGVPAKARELLRDPAPTPVEAVLTRYGLDFQAQTLRRIRLQQARALGL
jgi:FkbM family methyltransferase